MNLTGTGRRWGAPGADLVFTRPVVVRYLFTTGPVTRPNLLLMLDPPQRVPPLRLGAALAPNTALPFGYRSSRGDAGAYVDGLLLRAVDPADAVAFLAAGGAEVVEDPVGWMAARRDLVTDPDQRAAAVRGDRAARRLTIAAVIVWSSAAWAVAMPKVVGDTKSHVFTAVAVPAALALSWAARRRLRRGRPA